MSHENYLRGNMMELIDLIKDQVSEVATFLYSRQILASDDNWDRIMKSDKTKSEQATQLLFLVRRKGYEGYRELFNACKYLRIQSAVDILKPHLNPNEDSRQVKSPPQATTSQTYGIEEMSTEMRKILKEMEELRRQRKDDTERIILLESDLGAVSKKMKHLEQGRKDDKERIILLESDLWAVSKKMEDLEQGRKDDKERITLLESDLGAVSKKMEDLERGRKDDHERIILLESDLKAKDNMPMKELMEGMDGLEERIIVLESWLQAKDTDVVEWRQKMANSQVETVTTQDLINIKMVLATLNEGTSEYSKICGFLENICLHMVREAEAGLKSRSTLVFQIGILSADVNEIYVNVGGHFNEDSLQFIVPKRGVYITSLHNLKGNGYIIWSNRQDCKGNWLSDVLVLNKDKKRGNAIYSTVLILEVGETLKLYRTSSHKGYWSLVLVER